MNSPLSVGYVSTYPPRECGIATFTRDLARAILFSGHADYNIIVPVVNDSQPLLGLSEREVIRQYDRRSYVSAAGLLNEARVDIVSLQHEFGIYGGEWGEYVLDLCRNLEAPLITTFHTVLSSPVEKAVDVTQEIAKLSERVVVLVEPAAKFLTDLYGVEPQKIDVIHHGAVVPTRIHQGYARRKLHLQNRTILITTGFVSPGKGIEYAIAALPYLIQGHPDLLYLVIGETHPEVRRREGEAYRTKLVELVRELKVERHVRFVDRYVADEELSSFQQASDIYVAPYLGREQVSSGTITLALTHGKAVISTPTVFANEVLSNDRGLFCGFKDPRSIADCVHQILSDLQLRRRLEANAFKYGQELGWSRVADQYGDVFRSAIQLGTAFTETARLPQV